MKKFNQYHPKTRRQIQKAATYLMAEISDQAKKVAKATPGKSIYPVLTDIEVYTKNEGKIVHPVRVLDNRVLCGLSGQPIVKANAFEDFIATQPIAKTPIPMEVAA